MHHLDKYILRQLAHATLLIALSLTSIVWITQVLRLMDMIVRQGIPLDLFLLLTLWVIPSLLLYILPVSMLFALIFVYYKLRGDSELTVMEAAGLSLWQVARPGVAMAGGVVLMGYLISFYIMPASYGQYHSMQNFLRNNYVSVLLQEGVFNTPVPGLTVFIRERDDDKGILRGILLHDSREEGTQITMLANEGRLELTDAGQRFILSGGSRQELRKGKLSFLTFDSYGLDFGLYSKTRERKPEPQEMYLPQLLNTADLNPAELRQRQREAYQRISWPLYGLTLPLLALSVLLTSEFNRRGNIKRVALAVALPLAVLGVGIALGNWVDRHAVFLWLGYANLVLPALAAFLRLNEMLPNRQHRSVAA